MLKYSVLFAVSLFSVTSLQAGTLLSFDFNGPNPWPSTATDVMPSTPVPVEPSVEAKAVGTIDVAGTATPSGAMLLSAQVGDIKEKWEAVFASGLLAVKNTETNLGKLTIAFDLSASSARPVHVRISSFDAKKNMTGTLEGLVLPAAPDFYQRMVLDLSAMHGTEGSFNPTAPFVQFSFAIDGPMWGPNTTHELRVDNVHYASPALYVSPKGDDKNDGLTETTPLADPQAAVNLAKPGDIVVLMGGEYHRGPKNTVQDGIVSFRHTGSPAAWITLKNYPGQEAIIKSDAWHAIQIRHSKEDSVQSDGVVAYIEVRGLHVIGTSDLVKQNYAADIGLPRPTTNGGGISASGDGFDVPPHHIRFADNLAEKLCGGGIGASQSDWVTIENNIARDNCWYTIYATSGFGLLGWQNFDATDNVYKCLIRNNQSYNNRTYVIWKKIGRISDGNGIIIDTTYDPAKNHAYNGRTLIQNNLSYNNGGSGIHAYKARRIDIVNNTAYMNGASPALSWGQIFVQRSDDVAMLNNVLYARERQPINTVSAETNDKGNTNIVRANNVYFGSTWKAILGKDDVVADPLFVKPGTWSRAADFRLKTDSPAIGHGAWSPLVPVYDLVGSSRRLDRNPDAGAYQLDASKRQG